MTTPLPDADTAECVIDVCEVHERHDPVNHINLIHHIWPVEHGGPKTAANAVICCPSGHYNIRYLTDMLICADGDVPAAILGTFTAKETDLARRGFVKIQEVRRGT